MTIIQVNQQRLSYLLDLFGLTQEQLLQKINSISKNKKPIEKEEIFSNQIKLPALRKIDDLFKQGLNYYTDPSNIEHSEDNSIFFRKDSFNTKVNFGDRLRVNAIERDRYYLNALVKLCDYPLLNTSFDCNIKQNPEKVAQEVRERFYPKKQYDNDKDFLKALINKFSEQNIIVFEFVENWNLKYKSSVDGFFIAPNVIAIKRQEGSFKREIFTLVHELGHYLLNEEELDQPIVGQVSTNNRIEKWCDSFAFSFLIGTDKNYLLNETSNFSLRESKILKIVNEKHLSRLALFTNLAINGKISWEKYKAIQKELGEEYEKNRRQKETNKIIQREQGIENNARSPKPIRSSLEQDIYRNAFLSGVIGEYEVLKRFSSKDIDKLIYG